MDAHEKESPLPVYDPKVKGRDWGIGPVIDGYRRWTPCESYHKGSGSTRITNKCKNVTIYGFRAVRMTISGPLDKL
ncbi:hypothetical protein CRG98_016977 [Punica granatum]|uniref:Uncharacterized protein n=1 Tax=Punica granatum TaxID=22663 RepID=A0A2I0K241_PUNGR|nr:hypothetical protein CRG98_016977 [Punica granatum]